MNGEKTYEQYCRIGRQYKKRWKHRFTCASLCTRGTPQRLEQIRRLNGMAAERGQTLAQMALSWILKDDEVCSVLIGASKPEQIRENISVAEHTDFTKEELQKIEEIVFGAEV